MADQSKRFTSNPRSISEEVSGTPRDTAQAANVSFDHSSAPTSLIETNASVISSIPVSGPMRSVSQFNPRTQSLTTDQTGHTNVNERPRLMSQSISQKSQDSSSFEIQPIREPIAPSTPSSLHVESDSFSQIERRRLKSFSTREGRSTRQHYEDIGKLRSSLRTRDDEHSGGSPRLLPPVVIRTYSTKSRGKPPVSRTEKSSSILDQEYVSPFSPTFQRRKSCILEAPTEQIELSRSTENDSPNRSIQSNMSLRSNRSYSVVRRGPRPPSHSKSPNRSASVRFFRNSMKRLSNQASVQPLLSKSPDETTQETKIEITNHDIISSEAEAVTTKRFPSKIVQNGGETGEDSKKSTPSADGSASTNVQKSKKHPASQSEDTCDSDQMSTQSSDR